MDNIVIHLFETYRHFYLYDVNSNMVVEIGKILYDKLKQGMVLCQDLVQVKMRNFSPF